MSGEQSILICDDDETIRRLIVAILGIDGYAIRHSSDVGEALAALEESPPDLVILDVNVPGAGGGLGVLNHIRGEQTLNHVSVLLVTGVTEAHDDDWGRSLGADAHLLKPFELETFRHTVRDLVGARA